MLAQLAVFAAAPVVQAGGRVFFVLFGLAGDAKTHALQRLAARLGDRFSAFLAIAHRQWWNQSDLVRRRPPPSRWPSSPPDKGNLPFNMGRFLHNSTTAQKKTGRAKPSLFCPARRAVCNALRRYSILDSMNHRNLSRSREAAVNMSAVSSSSTSVMALRMSFATAP